MVTIYTFSGWRLHQVLVKMMNLRKQTIRILHLMVNYPRVGNRTMQARMLMERRIIQMYIVH